MIAFITAILLELRSALSHDVLSPKLTYDFLSAVAPESCPPEVKDNAKELSHVIMLVVQDIEWKKNKSAYFNRLVNKLSKVTRYTRFWKCALDFERIVQRNTLLYCNFDLVLVCSILDEYSNKIILYFRVQ